MRHNFIRIVLIITSLSLDVLGGTRPNVIVIFTDDHGYADLGSQGVLEDHPDIAERLQAKLLKWSGELSPPGLQTQRMATVWEQYYDYYLDGKPAPKRTTRPKGGWIPRNSTAGLKLPRKLTAVVRLRTEKPGPAAFAWREAGQKDFSPKHRVVITASGPVIHVRLMLPPTGADIESITFQNADGKPLKTWRFNK